MTGAPGFLEFFILEASEYVEQLDGLLVGARGNDLDIDTLQRLSRALRGSATMAKLQGFANVAAAMERVARAMRDGELRWDPALRGALVAAIDDLKTLLHAARDWSPADDQRAAARATELTLFAPPRTSSAFRPAGERTTPGGSSYLGNEAANIAAGLELLTTRPGDTQTASNVLGRIRALRGVAEVKEIGQLSDVLEATEDAAHGLDADASMSVEARRVLASATSYLRVLADALRGSGSIDAPSAARDEFSVAVADWRAHAGDAERVVPIAELFYEDGAPGVLEASTNPPTSPQSRFRLEIVSLSEHLRGVVDGLRRAPDADAVSRGRRELGRALRALRASAQSFGQSGVASRVADHLAPVRLEVPDLAALDALAASLAEPPTTGERTTQQVRRAAVIEPEISPRVTRPTPAVAQAEARESVAETAAPAPVSAPPIAPSPPPASVDFAGSAALLDSTIAMLDELASVPLFAPSPIPEDVIVPIDSLLYRGRAALDRAVELRDSLRRAGQSPDAEELEELFDLVELARAE